MALSLPAVLVVVLLLLLLLLLPPFTEGLAILSQSNCQGHTSDFDPHDRHAPIVVLHEDERVLAIDKPYGIPHHDDEDGQPGILSVMRQQQSDGLLDYRGRLYGVHRLDKVTSGVLLFAKNRETASLLTGRFRDGLVTKFYCGISSRNKPAKKQGWVKGSMVKGRRKSWYLTRDQQDGKNYAVTRFFSSPLGSLRQELVDDTTADARTLLLFRPHTGRTHQLRVAAKSVGLPLLGDPVYSDGTKSNNGPESKVDNNDQSESLSPRTYLHATGIHMETLDGDSADKGTNSGLTVFSVPPFRHLWQSEGAERFDGILTDLFRKHCDCEPIKELI